MRELFDRQREVNALYGNPPLAQLVALIASEAGEALQELWGRCGSGKDPTEQTDELMYELIDVIKYAGSALAFWDTDYVLDSMELKNRVVRARKLAEVEGLDLKAIEKSYPSVREGYVAALEAAEMAGIDV